MKPISSKRLKEESSLLKKTVTPQPISFVFPTQDLNCTYTSSHALDKKWKNPKCGKEESQIDNSYLDEESFYSNSDYNEHLKQKYIFPFKSLEYRKNAAAAATATAKAAAATTAKAAATAATLLLRDGQRKRNEFNVQNTCWTPTNLSCPSSMVSQEPVSLEKNPLTTASLSSFSKNEIDLNLENKSSIKSISTTNNNCHFEATTTTTRGISTGNDVPWENNFSQHYNSYTSSNEFAYVTTHSPCNVYLLEQKTSFQQNMKNKPISFSRRNRSYSLSCFYENKLNILMDTFHLRKAVSSVHGNLRKTRSFSLGDLSSTKNELNTVHHRGSSYKVTTTTPWSSVVGDDEDDEDDGDNESQQHSNPSYRSSSNSSSDDRSKLLLENRKKDIFYLENTVVVSKEANHNRETRENLSSFHEKVNKSSPNLGNSVNADHLLLSSSTCDEQGNNNATSNVDLTMVSPVRAKKEVDSLLRTPEMVSATSHLHRPTTTSPKKNKASACGQREEVWKNECRRRAHRFGYNLVDIWEIFNKKIFHTGIACHTLQSKPLFKKEVLSLLKIEFPTFPTSELMGGGEMNTHCIFGYNREEKQLHSAAVIRINRCFLELVFVASSVRYRGQGSGRLLVCVCAELAKELKKKYLIIDVSSKAKEFWQSTTLLPSRSDEQSIVDHPPSMILMENQFYGKRFEDVEIFHHKVNPTQDYLAYAVTKLKSTRV